MNGIRTAVSTCANSTQAVDAVLSGVRAEDNEISLLFCSARRNLSVVASHIHSRWPTARVVGCTSAGEITPEGYLNGSITAIGLPRNRFQVAVARIDDLKHLALMDVTRAAHAVRATLARKVGTLDPGRCFAILLVDGAAACEEKLAAALGAELAGISLVGGSAGDDWTAQSTPASLHAHVLHEGSFRRNSAVLLLVQTQMPWRAMTHTHYFATRSKAVITAACPDKRLVFEINGGAATPTYARLCGMSQRPRAGYDFSAHPAMVRIGGRWFPRGIFKLHADESIQFACAIERGLVVAVGEPENMARKLEAAFKDIRAQIGPPALVIGFDCAARTVHMDRNGLRAEISAIMRQNYVVGLSTLGEQYNTMHMNNSFTALVIGHG